jgi:hypothetical protein
MERHFRLEQGEEKRELFSGRAGQTSLATQASLAIDALDGDRKPHPVIRIDLNAGTMSTGELAARLHTGTN